MKTSKIILFSYIGLLALAFLGFVIFLTKFDHKARSREHTEYKTLTENLPAFKFISVDQQSLKIQGDDTSYLSMFVKIDSDISTIAYSCSNDTLYIKKSGLDNEVTLHLKNTTALNLVSRNSRVSINDLKLDTINYTAWNGSELRGFRNSDIQVMNTGLSGSRFYAFEGSISQLNLNAEKSSLNIRCKLASVTGQMHDNSELRLKNSGILNLKKDNSSRFYCYP